MAVAMSSDDSCLGPMIGLRALLETIWRKRRLWLITGLVGLVLGASLHLVIPRKYTAVTDLYLTAPAGADPAQAMVNNISLLQTEVVAQEAVTRGPFQHDSAHVALRLHRSIAERQHHVHHVHRTIPDRSRFRRSGRGQGIPRCPGKGVRLQTDGLVRGLRSQISSLNNEIESLNANIGGISGATPDTQSSNQLVDLVNQRSADETQVSQLQSQVDQALVSEQFTDRTNSVLDAAAVVPVSTKKVVLMDGLSGLVVGFTVGLAVVTFARLLSQERPDRSTVAATLGAPVELSVERYRSPRVMRRSRLNRQLREPSATLRMIERRLRGHLESAPGSALAVVAAGTPEPDGIGGRRSGTRLVFRGIPGCRGRRRR